MMYSYLNKVVITKMISFRVVLLANSDDIYNIEYVGQYKTARYRSFFYCFIAYTEQQRDIQLSSKLQLLISELNNILRLVNNHSVKTVRGIAISND